MAKPELNVTDAQASFVLSRAFRDKKISAQDVRTYLAEVQHEIKGLEARLARLREAHSGSAPQPAAQRPARTRRSRAKSHKPVAPEVAASRALQGRYISAIRQVPKNKRARFAAIAKEKGREAAIAAIKKG